MLNIFNLEKQAAKRVQSFLLHKSTEENMKPADAKLVIKLIADRATVYLFEQNRFLKTLTIQSIVEFFGETFDEAIVVKLTDYLKKLSKENGIPLFSTSIVICETKGQPGAHLYEETKYKKKIPTLNLLIHFNTNKQ